MPVGLSLWHNTIIGRKVSGFRPAFVRHLSGLKFHAFLTTSSAGNGGHHSAKQHNASRRMS